MGAGALGTYYGALLANNGYDVTFIARNKNLEALKSQGIQVKSHFGDFSVSKVNATDNTKDIGEVDLILFSVKTFDTQQASRSLLAMIGKQTIVLPLQTVDVTNALKQTIGKEHVVGGVTYISCDLDSYGIVNQPSPFRKIVIGELTGKISERIQSLGDVFIKLGVDTIVTPDIKKEMWNKFIYIAPMCSIGSITRLPLGQYRDVPESRALLVGVMKEIELIARADGTNLDTDIIDQKLQAIDKMNLQSTNSMQRDVINGKRSELEGFIGTIIELGKKHNILTPLHTFVYASLKPRELLLQ